MISKPAALDPVINLVMLDDMIARYLSKDTEKLIVVTVKKLNEAGYTVVRI